MNIIEAIKSGKRYQRNGVWFHYDVEYYSYSREELIANDWEIEEETRPISKSQILDFMTKFSYWRETGKGDPLRELHEKLGFKE